MPMNRLFQKLLDNNPKYRDLLEEIKRELEERRKKADAIEATKSDIGFGHQIRSYVLHPYKLVKDHRTDHENRQPDEVLDGDLDALINEFLVQSANPPPAAQ